MKHRLPRAITHAALAALLAMGTLAGGCAHESISPEVMATPHAAEESIETLGAYIRAREPDPMRRLRAVHDWVAGHIAYDVNALHSAEIPRNATTTFPHGRRLRLVNLICVRPAFRAAKRLRWHRWGIPGST